MTEMEFHTRVASVLKKFYPSWYDHRWNEETASELYTLVSPCPCDEVVKLLREFYHSNNQFSHAEFEKAVRKRFRRRHDPSNWTVADEHQYRMLWIEKRTTFREMTDDQFDEFCWKIIGKRPSQHERSEATALLNRHIKEANERMAERGSKTKLNYYPVIDPGF